MKPRMAKITPLPPTAKGVLTLPQAASYLGIAEGTLRNWISERRITYVKVGTRTMFRQSALDAFLDAHTVPAVAAK